MIYKENSGSTVKNGNFLKNESSPYLLQHAYNPVLWYPWSEEAFRKAREEDKPIIVSIGYSTCHWCHVMERESFESDEIAELMNEHYVSIKVDREERPDIDRIYMDALQAMNVQGGWPLNVFLTPEAKPFYGGTYFPPAHWAHLLKQIHKAFENNRSDLEKSAAQFHKILNQTEIEKYELYEHANTFSPEDLDKIYLTLEKGFDKKMGGLDKTPKFPMPTIYSFLLKYFHLSGNENALNQVKLTLNKLAWGGIYDQIKGGFARYSTDSEWFAPHFEKMLYDNGQLISLYSEAYVATKDDYYRQIVFETINWAKTEMMSEEGGFYSAMDADTEDEEGKYYVWTHEELKSIIKDDFDLFKDYYNIKTRGNWEMENNILYRSLSDKAFSNKHRLTREELDGKIKNWKNSLIKQREKRIRPAIDDKILASWNGLMLNGLIDAYRCFDETSFLELGLKNAKFLRSQMYKNGKIYHKYKNGEASINGYHDDYAFIIQAYLNLYEAVFEEEWLKESIKLTDYVINHFYDPEEMMFYFTGKETEKLIARKKEILDNVVPSSNSVMASNLFKLGYQTGKQEYIEIATSMIARIKKLFKTEPGYLSNWASLLIYLVKPVPEIAIVGNDCIEKRKELDKVYMPNKIVAGTSSKSDSFMLKDRVQINNKTTFFVCFNRTCKLPVHSLEETLEQINEV